MKTVVSLCHYKIEMRLVSERMAHSGISALQTTVGFELTFN
jgi:hypothetical protein